MQYKTGFYLAILTIASLTVSDVFAESFHYTRHGGGASGGVTSGGSYSGGSGNTFPTRNTGPSFKTLNLDNGGGGTTRVVQQYTTIHIPIANPYPPFGNYRKSSNRPVMKLRK